MKPIRKDLPDCCRLSARAGQPSRADWCCPRIPNSANWSMPCSCHVEANTEWGQTCDNASNFTSGAACQAVRATPVVPAEIDHYPIRVVFHGGRGVEARIRAGWRARMRNSQHALFGSLLQHSWAVARHKAQGGVSSDGLEAARPRALRNGVCSCRFPRTRSLLKVLIIARCLRLRPSAPIASEEKEQPVVVTRHIAAESDDSSRRQNLQERI